MTRVIRLKDLESAAANASLQPFFTTKAEKRNGYRVPPYVQQGIIFEEHFDDQPDWHSGLPENDQGGLKASGDSTVDITQFADTHTLPEGWDFVRQVPVWAPSRGQPDKHEVIEILSSNADKSRSGEGKSFVSWRESDDSRGSTYWNSDGNLSKYFPEGYTEIYAEFWITFSDEMVSTYYNPDYKSETIGSGKMFRVYHWKPEYGGPYSFFGGTNNPHFIWGIGGRPASNGGYGFRNTLNFLTRRDGDTEGKYLDSSGNIIISEPSSYRTDIENPNTIPDIKNGGLIDSGAVDIDQVFGGQTHWTKMAFYVKMNSAPGVYDGVFKQWVDDHRIQNISTVNWVESGRNMVPWNVVSFGGNDNFNKYPSEDRVEEWYAIDDIKIFDSLPEELK